MKVSGHSALVKVRSPMAAVGFLRSLWEKPIWDGVWPYSDPMDTVCLRTASMEWNVPGKYGPQCELFFFLIQKEPAIAPNSETFSLSSILASALPFSPLMSLRSARFSPCTLWRKKEEKSPTWRKSGKWTAQRSPKWESEGEAWSEDESVSSTASHKDNMCNNALHVIGLHGSGDKISLFLQDWELAKVALSCRMALDMLCQGMREGW